MSTYEHLPSAEESEMSFSEFKFKHQHGVQGLWRKVTIGSLLGFLAGLIISSVNFSYMSGGTWRRNYSPGEGLPLIGETVSTAGVPDLC